MGFESGADDYLPKPFELAILLARIRGTAAAPPVAARAPAEPAKVVPAANAAG